MKTIEERAQELEDELRRAAGLAPNPISGGEYTSQEIPSRPSTRHLNENRLSTGDGEALLTKEQLCSLLNLKSIRTVEELTRRRKIPVIRLGHRTTRYSWSAVQTALQKLTVNEI